ncbi:sigma-54-dependent Fis family transcriptional regulator [Maritimibacter sp. 55A14]|uniref:sigma-54-dependent transcriptional regulator n=1 Tax=Maritimibacter sp. 55A14 TaxID=2174844 RepID=UPI000D620795|nr:sigma-54 dependent transcriptional regulator [Maritimibacter sp. 55A14]PWE32568.1 sigma-54-dependent Fis family transcriptional regulator [Maritimibacter sp. 55A14]
MNQPQHPSARDGTPAVAPAFGADLAHASILVVDGDPEARDLLSSVLGPHVRRIEAAASPEDASRCLDTGHFDIVILENALPGRTGLDWLREQNEVGLFAETILVTENAHMETAIEALRAGAADLVLKPFGSSQILSAVGRCLDRLHQRRDNFILKGAERRGRLLGTSPAIAGIVETLEKLAPLATPVLFTGATGTGKEVAARTLHALSDRAEKPFVPVNCAAISPGRIHDDLFGSVSAAGTERRDGLLLHANGGTLFLDEIAEMPRPVQGAILRVIEERRIRPAGATRELRLNLRFLISTNADLDRAVAAGRFRADLFHRISVMTVRMPCLKDRLEDLPALADAFIHTIARDRGVKPLDLTGEVLANLARHDWPGNVRELRNTIERALVLGRFPDEIAGHGPAPGVSGDPVDSLQAVERRHILGVLEACGGNRAEAARRLGIARKTIDRKCAMWKV